MFRWATAGVKLPNGERGRLETAKLNGRLVTSREAITRFLQRQSPDVPTSDPSPVRTPTRRQRQQEHAEATLAERYGI